MTAGAVLKCVRMNIVVVNVQAALIETHRTLVTFGPCRMEENSLGAITVLLRSHAQQLGRGVILLLPLKTHPGIQIFMADGRVKVFYSEASEISIRKSTICTKHKFSSDHLCIHVSYIIIFNIM